MNPRRPGLPHPIRERSFCNVSWACFDCRIVVRRDIMAEEAVACPHCHRPCRNVGHRIRVPKRTDLRAWRLLRLDLRREALAELALDQVMRVRECHRAERKRSGRAIRPRTS